MRAPLRSAAAQAREAAPPMPGDPATTSAAACHLWVAPAPAGSASTSASITSAQASRSSSPTARPMSATVVSPHAAGPSPNSRPGLSPANVIVRRGRPYRPAQDFAGETVQAAGYVDGQHRSVHPTPLGAGCKAWTDPCRRPRRCRDPREAVPEGSRWPRPREPALPLAGGGEPRPGRRRRCCRDRPAPPPGARNDPPITSTAARATAAPALSTSTSVDSGAAASDLGHPGRCDDRDHRASATTVA